MIILKSRQEIERMWRAGRVVVEAHRVARRLLRPGVTTREVAAAIEGFLQSVGAEPVFREVGGRRPFPATCCVSVNDEVIHGVPGDRRLQSGDLVTLDIGCRWRGWCSDAAWSYAVGPVASEIRCLLETGGRCLRRAVEELRARPSGDWYAVACRLEQFVRARGVRLIAGFSGHGIGRELHEDPQVPLAGIRTAVGRNFSLRPGLVFTMEPIVTAGSGQTRLAANGWTVYSIDGRPTAHFEWTVAMTEHGPEVLTPGLDAESGKSFRECRGSVEKTGRNCL
ncbi:MAG TPA: type I methionyl aminopeptidase [Planctomycetaceae bacterium]|nr:type I methionyl aminopeptidase [Planctomycetaceae bacterium]